MHDNGMNATLRAIGVLLRLRLQLLRRGRKRSGPARNRGGSLIVGAVVIVVLAVQFGALIVDAVTPALTQGLATAQGRAALTSTLTGLSSSVSLFLFLLATPSVLALFTYSSDLKLLLLTPLPPRAVLGEKFLTVYLGLAAPVLVFGLLIAAGIGQATGVGVLFYLVAALMLLALPATPVALAMLLTVGVLRWVPPARARAVTAVLGAVLGGSIYIGTQLLVRNASYGSVGGPPRLLTGVGQGWWSIVPISWPGHALGAYVSRDAAITSAYAVAAVVCAAVLAVLAVTTSARLFTSGWASYQEVSRRARAAAVQSPALTTPAALPGGAARRVAGASASAWRRPAWWPLLGKEWRTLRRDPQVWARLLYALVVIGFLFWQNLSRASLTSSETGGIPASFVSIGFFGLLCLLLWLPLSTLALPSVNREGRAARLLALAPLSARDILLAKWIFSALPSLVIGELLLAAGAAVLHLDPAQVAFGACALACIAVALAGALILVSLIWPRLDWDNPRRQVSTEANLIGGFGGLVLMGFCAALLVLTLLLADGNPLLAIASGAGLFVLTGLIILVVLLLAPARLQALLTGER